jgi:hypothetical protein
MDGTKRALVEQHLADAERRVLARRQSPISIQTGA